MPSRLARSVSVIGCSWSARRMAMRVSEASARKLAWSSVTRGSNMADPRSRETRVFGPLRFGRWLTAGLDAGQVCSVRLERDDPVGVNLRPVRLPAGGFDRSRARIRFLGERDHAPAA